MPGKRYTNSELQETWRDRWRDFLHDIERTAAENRLNDGLRDKVEIGNAERRIAGGHEEREILELLQNARDAILRGNADTGQVYIGVHDEGVLVANTGSEFDFFDEDVEEAVTMIGETGKPGDTETNSIGYKGVGLRSILATGDSFEIYTRPDERDDEILGVRLSRAYLLAGILQRLGKDIQFNNSLTDVEDERLRTLIEDESESDPVSLDEETRTKLSKLPLFNFPVTLDVESATDDPIINRATELLRNRTNRQKGEIDAAADPYRTAVFVRYEDATWRELLDAEEIPLPEEGDRGAMKNDASPVERADDMWEYLSRFEEGGLNTETVIQLGGIDELVIERISGSDKTKNSIERWTIDTDRTSLPETGALCHDWVTVSIESSGDEMHTETFDRFQFESTEQNEEDEIDVRLLIDTEAQGERQYPLYLFYPIDNTDTVPLPFCLHGRFRVETTRKDLSTHRIERNKTVVDRAVDLITAAAEVTANHNSSRFGDFYPWILLPPVPEERVTEPRTRNELLEWFCGNVYERLSETACLPVAKEGTTAVSPPNTTLYWDPTVRSALRAVQQLASPRGAVDEGDHHLPSLPVLEACTGFPASWDDRIERVVRTDREPDAWAEAVTKSWARILDEYLGGAGEPLSAQPEQARALLRGTVQLIAESREGDENRDAFLDELAPRLDGVRLLPCQNSSKEGDVSELRLVSIEQRGTPDGSKARSQQSRSVMWDIESPDQEKETPPAPSPKMKFTVYFLDTEVEEDPHVSKILDLAGDYWGIRRYRGWPDYYRSLLDTFAFGGESEFGTLDLLFLVGLMPNLEEGSDDLQIGESYYLPTKYLQKAISQQDGDRRQNLRRRLQIRSCTVELIKEGTVPLSEICFGDEWQRQVVASTTDTDESDGAEELEDLFVETIEYPYREWPAPKADSWNKLLEAVTTGSDKANVGETLSLLGSSCLPAVRTLWLYGKSHPEPRTDPAWDPTEWDGDIGEENDVKRLQAVLNNLDSTYQKWITSPGFHPADSGDHSSACDVLVDREITDTHLASWVWFDNIEQIEALGPDVITLLKRHGQNWRSSILETGWSCNHDHNRRTWDERIPTLLNWQLRELPIWESLLELGDDVASQWGEDASSLHYAVLADQGQGPQASRLFPNVDPTDVKIPTDVLESLGVKSLNSINVTEAQFLLQKLLQVLAEEDLSGKASLDIPSERDNDWNRAYTKLLQPIMERAAQNPDQDLEWTHLTHLPLLQADQWVAAPIDWIIDPETDAVCHYEERSPKPWEKREVEDEGLYVLQYPTEGKFKQLADALGVDEVDASKEVMKASDLSFVGNQYEEQLAELKRLLRNRRDLLVASTEREDEDQIRKTATTITNGINSLEIAESFPESVASRLSDRRSGLYETDTGQEALVFNLEECSQPLEAEELAMALSLLVERPTTVPTFREVLDSGEDRERLERRWENLTFPIVDVKRILGTQAERMIEQRFEALTDLYSRLDNASPPTLDNVRDKFRQFSPSEIDQVAYWLATGESPPEFISNSSNIMALHKHAEELDENFEAVVRHVFNKDPDNSWAASIESGDFDAATESTLIDWVAANASRLPGRPGSPELTTIYGRLETVVRASKTSNDEAMSTLEGWEQQLNRFDSGATPEWADELLPQIAEAAGTNRVFYLGIEDRLDQTIETILTTIEDDLPDGSDDLRAALKTYIDTGTPPDPTEVSGSQAYQERAFRDVEQLASGGMDGWISDPDPDTPNPGSIEVTVGASNSRGGGSSQLKGRGQQAEVFTMVTILDRMCDWLDSVPAGMLRQFKTEFQSLYDDQAGADYQWHVKTTWENGLLDILSEKELLNEKHFEDWCSVVSDSGSLTNHPFISLINVTMEQGPGFDVIDPFGSLSTDVTRIDANFAFTPVEIKAVSGTQPPFSFRLTTNEYRRCKAFVEAGYPYAIRLVAVPDADMNRWFAGCEFAAEIWIESVNEVEQMMSNKSFDKVIKGGYMNVQV